MAHREFDPLATTRPITVRYETVCSRCGRPVLRGEEAVWYSHQDKREEVRPKRRIACQTCEPLRRRSSGNVGIVKGVWRGVYPERGQGTSFRDYIRQRTEKEKTR